MLIKPKFQLYTISQIVDLYCRQQRHFWGAVLSSTKIFYDIKQHYNLHQLYETLDTSCFPNGHDLLAPDLQTSFKCCEHHVDE